MPPIFRRVVGCVLSVLMVLAGVSVAFPVTPLDVDIELYYDAAWNNIDSYVYHREMSPITIARGRTAEGKRCDPGKLILQLNNRDGRFSPRNPNSPLYGKIGRNTPIRIQVTHNAVTYTRFFGEVTSWPSRWDVSGRDIWVPLEAAGILRRLGQGSKPLRSPLFRAVSGVAAGDYVPIDYWPLEDGPTSTRFGGGLAGSPAVVPTGTVTFGSDGPTGAAGVIVADAGFSAAFPVQIYADTGRWAITWIMNVPASPTADTTLLTAHTVGGTLPTWRLLIDPDSFGGVDQIKWIGYDSSDVAQYELAVIVDGDPLFSPGTEAELYGSWRMWTVGAYNRNVDQVGSTVTIDNGSDKRMRVINGNVLVGEVGAVRDFSLTVDANLDGVALGHFGVFVDPGFAPFEEAAALANGEALHGWDGDVTTDRFDRLCSQVQVPFTITGSSETLIGPEREVTFLQAARDAEDVEQGFLMERRDALGLKFRTLSSKYDQVPIALDYDVGDISPPLDPEPDDQNVANDREVKRRNGSSARRELTSGPLSVQDPPDGIGRYDDSITVDAYTDDQVEHIANWRLHVGTWDAERYPRVHVDLAANPGLIPTIAAADSGDLLTISNLPAWLPPEDAELIIEGYAERIGFYDWDLVFACSPGGPYNVVGRWPLLSKELHAAINSSVTSIDIANTDVTQPMLATAAADIGSAGYGTKIGGEELQLTAVTASTVTFGATGTASTGSSGSRTPGLPTGSASGNLILIFASTRNSGTGIPDTPADWDRLPIFPATANAQVFGRIYDGVWSMPTVTFTGGAANEDTIAQSCRLAGKWHDPANVVIAGVAKLNASAQNVAYPGLPKPRADDCIILYFAWKQDDFTSATSPGTEIQEASTAAGLDASQVWAYSIQTTAAAVAAGSFTISGGASAISRGAIAALRCDYQTATVTRSTNGVSASHSAGDAVTLTRPMRWGLL